jgi:hypothetical protein
VLIWGYLGCPPTRHGRRSSLGIATSFDSPAPSDSADIEVDGAVVEALLALLDHVPVADVDRLGGLLIVVFVVAGSALLRAKCLLDQLRLMVMVVKSATSSSMSSSASALTGW